MKALFEGQVGEQTYTVRLLTMEDLASILQLQTDVYESLEDKTALQPLTTEEFEVILHGEGLMIGAFVKNNLIAFRALLVPPLDEDHLGYDIGLSEEELNTVIYQEISNVHPAYRGFGLQKTLASIIMAELDHSHYDYVCATVKPFNIPSLKDKFVQGMMIGALKVKYGGLLRYVFFKKLRQEETAFTQECLVLMSDTQQQQRLLAEGWLGVQLHEDTSEWYVIYKK